MLDELASWAVVPEGSDSVLAQSVARRGRQGMGDEAPALGELFSYAFQKYLSAPETRSTEWAFQGTPRNKALSVALGQRELLWVQSASDLISASSAALQTQPHPHFPS